ncbi:MAG TPA: hypothetical protein VMF61_12240 [Candidatus Acidoferrales bacterium]|nr:hypothetical protein [Candidatus Acidoferrales bacterium]
MRLLREVYEFVTGGSIAAPAGLVIAAAGAGLLAARGETVLAAGTLLGTLVLTLAAATLERAR